MLNVALLFWAISVLGLIFSVIESNGSSSSILCTCLSTGWGVLTPRLCYNSLLRPNYSWIILSQSIWAFVELDIFLGVLLSLCSEINSSMPIGVWLSICSFWNFLFFLGEFSLLDMECKFWFLPGELLSFSLDWSSFVWSISFSL